jgi:hypothetical protein
MGATYVIFSAEQAAAALWTYGENHLIDQALAMSDDDLHRLWAWAGLHWRVDHRLPLKSRLVVDKVTAFACIELFEGSLRPLATERRRPRKTMPLALQKARPVPPGTMVP